MSNPIAILVVDDEDDVRELVCMNLRRAGYATHEASHGAEALEMMTKVRPQAVVLDVMMPGLSGLQVCERVRANPQFKDVLILMLTAKGQTQDRIDGLETGADDYVSKPFSPKELVLRIQALLRRFQAPIGNSQQLKIGKFEFDLAAVKLSIDEEPIELTLLEFKLLHLLASHEGRVVERDVILREVWGYSENVRTRTLDTHVKRLREKLGEHAECVQTARGFGYVFSPNSSEGTALLEENESGSL